MTKYYPEKTYITTNCFQNSTMKTKIINVDLSKTPWKNSSMYNSFMYCSNLVSISNINENVTNMAYTFFNCTNLQNVSNIPNSVTNMWESFGNCTSLVNVPVIPNSVTEMSGTFSGCTSLVNAPVIPNSVENMDETFSGCTSLVNAPVIPNSVYNIQSTFYYCTNLVNVPGISNSVIKMYQTFYYCTNLQNVSNIPNSVIDMTETFCECYNLVNAPNISNSVVNMFYTYYGCTNLQNVPKIPDSVTNMWETFGNCISLVNAPVISNSILDMNGTFSGCISLVNAPVIPNSVTEMSGTFQNCTNLINIPPLPNSISILSGVFSNCISLVNAPVIPNSVTEMSGTFQNCTNLTNDIIIYSNQITYADNCFSNTNLEKDISIYFKYENSVNTLTYNSFISAGYSPVNRKNGAKLIDMNDFYYINFNISSNENTVKYLNGDIIENNRQKSSSNNEYILYNENYPMVIGHINKLNYNEEYNIDINMSTVTGYSVILNTNLTDCNVQFNINKIITPAIIDNTNYSIILNTDEEINIGYTITKNDYQNAEGTLIFNNVNIMEDITMSGEIIPTWVNWTRPNLSQDGTMGGNTFAVKAQSNSSQYAYYAVDASRPTYWESLKKSVDYILYNPNPLKISSFNIIYSDSTNKGSSLVVKGSNNNSSWDSISSTYTSATSSTLGTLNLNNDNGYKYYKLSFVSKGTKIKISNMDITALVLQ